MQKDKSKAVKFPDVVENKLEFVNILNCKTSVSLKYCVTIIKYPS